MCIIIAKDKSGRVPTIEELKNSFEYNSDGAGFMYVDKGQVVIDKGYMEEAEFLNRYIELCEEFNNFDNKCLVVHCRIGTSSSNTAGNTHPYPITYREKELHKTRFTCDLAMAHNGIISDYTPTWDKPTTNDSQEFILKYLYPLYSKWSDFYKNKYILSGLSDITGSKLAFLDKDDNLYLVGDFVEDNNLQFSNTTYKSYVYKGRSVSPYDWKDWHDESYLDDYDDYVRLETEDYNRSYSGFDFDYYYDMNNDKFDYSKIYLNPGYLIKFGDCDYVMVSEDDMYVWDYNSGDLYVVNYKGELDLVEEGVIVLDENDEELV